MKGRPTRRVYIEILMCVVLFLDLEDSRRTQAEAEPGGAQPSAPAPTLSWRPITLRLTDYAPPPLRIKENRAIKVGFIQQPTFN